MQVNEQTMKQKIDGLPTRDRNCPCEKHGFFKSNLQMDIIWQCDLVIESRS